MKLVIKADATKDIAPDFMEITIKCKGFDESDRIKSTELMLERLKFVKGYLKDMFDSSLDIRTNDVNVKEIYDYVEHKYKDDFGDICSRDEEEFKGYVSEQELNFGVALDMEKAIKMTLDLSEKDKVYVYVSYCLKDSYNFQNEVLLEALDIARKKAEVIASKFNASTCECTLVDYVDKSQSRLTSDFMYSLHEGSFECERERTSHLASELAELTQPSLIVWSESVRTEYEIS